MFFARWRQNVKRWAEARKQKKAAKQSSERQQKEFKEFLHRLDETLGCEHPPQTPPKVEVEFLFEAFVRQQHPSALDEKRTQEARRRAEAGFGRPRTEGHARKTSDEMGPRRPPRSAHTVYGHMSMLGKGVEAEIPNIPQSRPSPGGLGRETTTNQDGDPTPTAWQQYETRWKRLGHSPSHRLKFVDIPWPVQGSIRTPEELTSENIVPFVLSVSHPANKTERDRIRAGLRTWHPDKFEGRYMAMIEEDQKDLVRQGIMKVTMHLTEALTAGSK